MKKLFLLIPLLFLLNACEEDKTDLFDVVYEVEFVATWSQTSHPTDFPSDPHFSPLVVVSHNPSADVFQEGLSASAGVTEVAETGATGIIEDELQVLINQSIALDQNKGKRVDSPGSDKVQIGVGIGYSTVTALSMIAPSPDWFVAAKTNLIDPNDGLWFDEVTVDVLSYDSGTDGGNTFTSADAPLDPALPITQITSGPLTEGDSVVVNMGQFIFRRVQ